MSKTYLLTGGTGFLGSLLSIELIKGGNMVIFLGRPKNGKTFQERIGTTLKTIEPSISLNNIKTIEIDLQKEDLGLSSGFIKQFSGKIDAIWHLAANLSFKEKNREEIFATNLGGLKNILNLASRLKTPVYYTSTVYVHGQRPGIIFEDDLIKPNCFNNSYEESKFEAEKIIQEWGKSKENKFIIFRPSILIDRKQRTLNFFGYYAIVYAFYKIRQKFKAKQVKIYFPYPYCKKALLNLMPIDMAIEWILKISSFPKALGKTFHITNPLPSSIKEATTQTLDALNLKIPIFPAPKWFVKLCFSLPYWVSFIIKPIGSFVKELYYYRNYLIQCNTYDMKNTKEILGQGISNQFNFNPNFIENIARDFVKKVDKIKNQ